MGRAKRSGDVLGIYSQTGFTGEIRQQSGEVRISLQAEPIEGSPFAPLLRLTYADAHFSSQNRDIRVPAQYLALSKAIK